MLNPNPPQPKSQSQRPTSLRQLDDELHNWLPWFPSCLSMRIYRRKTSEKIDDVNPPNGKAAKLNSEISNQNTRRCSEAYAKNKPLWFDHDDCHFLGGWRAPPQGSSFCCCLFVASSSPRNTQINQVFFSRITIDPKLGELSFIKYGCTWNLKHPRIEMVVLIR